MREISTRARRISSTAMSDASILPAIRVSSAGNLRSISELA